VDQAWSGGSVMRHRPYGELLFARVQAGDIIVVAKLERGFRDAADCLMTVREMYDLGVRIIVLDKNLDATDPGSFLMVGIQAVVAEDERRKIGIRTKESLDYRRAKGFAFGKAPMGYKNIARRVGGKQVKIRVEDMGVRKTACLAWVLRNHFRFTELQTHRILIAMQMPAASPEGGIGETRVRKLIARYESDFAVHEKYQAGPPSQKYLDAKREWLASMTAMSREFYEGYLKVPIYKFLRERKFPVKKVSSSGPSSHASPPPPPEAA
jgi:hypothetical protein